jgi:DNA-binding NtrC family response regulator
MMMKKILVLECDLKYAHELEQALWATYHVITKTSTVNLAEVYHQLMPDVILLADGMGIWQADDLAALLKLKCRHDLPPLISLSWAIATTVPLAKIYAAAYLHKPVSFNKLYFTIEHVLIAKLANADVAEQHLLSTN